MTGARAKEPAAVAATETSILPKAHRAQCRQALNELWPTIAVCVEGVEQPAIAEENAVQRENG
ncbi:MAG: hypothetical protein ACYCW6_30380 [Candidatus Xenobia bacterium]